MTVDLWIKYNVIKKTSQHEADLKNLLTLPDQVKYCLSITSRNQDLSQSKRNAILTFFQAWKLYKSSGLKSRMQQASSWSQILSSKELRGLDILH